MSPDATPVSSTEGLRFDEPAPEGGSPVCARCQAAIVAEYYEVNGHVVCASCKAALEQAPAGSGTSRLIRAAAYGFGAAVLGAGLYYAILAATGYEIGLVAIAVGWLVGRAVHKGSNGVGGWSYQTLAVGLTYLAIVSTYLPFIVKSMDQGKPGTAVSATAAPASTVGADSVSAGPASPAEGSRGKMTLGGFAVGILLLIAIAAAAPFLAGIENVIGLVIIGFALYQAWKMNRRVPLAITGPYAVGQGGTPAQP
jgi:hypothetical protein